MVPKAVASDLAGRAPLPDAANQPHFLPKALLRRRLPPRKVAGGLDDQQTVDHRNHQRHHQRTICSERPASGVFHCFWTNPQSVRLPPPRAAAPGAGRGGTNPPFAKVGLPGRWLRGDGSGEKRETGSPLSQKRKAESGQSGKRTKCSHCLRIWHESDYNTCKSVISVKKRHA